MIEDGLIDPEYPIDLASVCNAQLYKFKPHLNHYGINLTDNGIDTFKLKLNIEVQYASEQTIAAIERNGGTITTAYFDIKSVIALSDPLNFFKKGILFYFIFLKLMAFFKIRRTNTKTRAST